MLCELCEKNKATHQYTEIVNDQKTVIHLCDECAQKQGLKDTPKVSETTTEEKLKALSLETFFKIKKQVEAKREEKPCLHCGWTYSQFRKKGRLGCPYCYDVFFEKLSPIIQDIHSSLKHVGKQPGVITAMSSPDGHASVSKHLEQLRRELDLAVETESFERAAELRDQIRNLSESSVE